MTNVRVGDLMYAKVLNQHMVIINSIPMAKDLLEKRSKNYSDRPRFVTLGEMYVLIFG